MKKVASTVGQAVCWSIVALFACSQASCVYYAGATTYTVQRTTGTAYLSATERNGQWDTDGPPPRGGDITVRSLYRKLERAATYSTRGTAKEYEMSELLPLGRYLLTSVREVGTAVEGNDTIHYYEVQFEEGNGGAR